MRPHRSVAAAVPFVVLWLASSASGQRQETPSNVQFASPIVIHFPGSYPGNIAAGDFNNAGLADLIVGAQYGDVFTKLSRGDGTFGRWINAFSPSHAMTAIALGRFNGKNLDAMINDNNDAWVLLGDGKGGFPSDTWLDADGNFVAGFAAGDFNGDGKQDIAALVAIPSQNYIDSTQVYLYLGNGTGTFQSPRKFRVSPVGPVAILAGDFNGDGKLDLAVLSSYLHDHVGRVSVLLGDGKGGFDHPIDFPLHGLYPKYPVAMVMGDFNEDQKNDLALAYAYATSNRGSFVQVLLGNGDGTFREGVRAPAGPNPVSIAAADFNGDGIPDLVVANSPCYMDCSYESSISVLLGNGNGTFQPPARFAVHGQTSSQLTVADFNGDGKPDVATVNSNSQNVSILLNTTPFRARKASRTHRLQH